MVFYEAPHKLIATLSDMLDTFGERKVALVRELTKLHEQVIRTTLNDAQTLYNEDNPPRGEFVIIVEGYTEDENSQSFTLEDATQIAKRYLAMGDSASAAAKKASADTGLRKGDIYKALNN